MRAISPIRLQHSYVSNAHSRRRQYNLTITIIGKWSVHLWGPVWCSLSTTSAFEQVDFYPRKKQRVRNIADVFGDWGPPAPTVETHYAIRNARAHACALYYSNCGDSWHVARRDFLWVTIIILYYIYGSWMCHRTAHSHASSDLDPHVCCAIIRCLVRIIITWQRNPKSKCPRQVIERQLIAHCSISCKMTSYSRASYVLRRRQSNRSSAYKTTNTRVVRFKQQAAAFATECRELETRNNNYYYGCQPSPSSSYSRHCVR